MSEMVERVAAILTKQLCFACEGCSCKSSDDCDGAVTETDRVVARAVIAAMRDPTETQITAVDKACHEHWPNARKMAVAMQHALIDAALIDK